MTEHELLADCLHRLNGLGIVYYLTGSMASNYWGIPRTTHDLDFVVRIDVTAVRPLVAAFQGDYYIDEAAVEACFCPPHQFNAIDTRSALKVDFWLASRSPFDEEMLRRRILTKIASNDAWIATAEDVILHKLVWNKITPSDRQLGDAAGVWAIQGDRLDGAYLGDWSSRLGVQDDLKQIATGKIRPKAT